jgi:hypothetical protein
MEYAKVGGEPVENSFAVKTGEVGKELVDRMTAAESYLSVELPQVISSDYTKLKIVGSCASPLAKDHADCPFTPSDWQYTSDDQKDAAHGLRDSSRVAIYGALLPAKYTAWNLLPLSKHLTANTDFAGRAGLACFYPFKDEPSNGQLAVPQDADADGFYKVTALGFLTGDGTLTDRWQMHVPTAALVDRLFGSGSGDLAVNKEAFFDRFFGGHQQSGLHYPERDTPTGWNLSLC